MIVGFAEPEVEETELARRTAKALDLPVHVVKLTFERVAELFDHAVWAMDQPTVDGLNSYWISKLAAEFGYKVAVSGQVGDERFGGYTMVACFEVLNTNLWSFCWPFRLVNGFVKSVSWSTPRVFYPAASWRISSAAPSQRLLFRSLVGFPGIRGLLSTEGLGPSDFVPPAYWSRLSRLQSGIAINSPRIQWDDLAYGVSSRCSAGARRCR